MVVQSCIRRQTTSVVANACWHCTRWSRCIVLLIVLLVFICGAQAFAQEADAILGRWYTENDEAIVEIKKKGATYSGSIIFLKVPLEKDGTPKLDKENPDPSKRKQPILGLEFLTGFSYSNGQWTGGTIYDPESGKTYTAKMYFTGENLEVRGYVLGLPFLGRSQIWTRHKKS